MSPLLYYFLKLMFIYYDAKLDRSVPRGANFQMSLSFLIPCICKVWSMVFIFTCVCSENNIGLAGSESRLITQVPSEIERLNKSYAYDKVRGALHS